MSAENGPSLPLKWGDKILEMTADNSHLYTFIGKAAIVVGESRFEMNRSALNHIWVATAADRGMYFWEQHDSEQYKPMSDFMIEHAFPAHLNSKRADPSDITAWLREVDKAVGAFAISIPDAI